MWQVAQAFLAGAAEVVAVATAIAVDFGVDQATGASGGVTALAVERAFEVVAEYPVALPTAGAQVEHLLDSVEQGLADDGLMSTRNEIAVDEVTAAILPVNAKLLPCFHFHPVLGETG